MKVGIIGGFGKFGSKLTERLETGGFDVLRTPDKSENGMLASSSDVLILSVPPSEVESVLCDIRNSLKNSEIISCAAFINASQISELIRGRCIRIMSDPSFLFLAVLGHSNIAENVLNCLSQERANLDSDEEINRFTKILSIFFVTLSVKGKNSALSLEGCRYLLEYFSEDYIKKMVSQFSPPEIDLYLTKNGLSEFILAQINSSPEITFSKLLETIEEKYG